MTNAGVDWLRDLRAVELGDTIATAAAGQYLRSLGVEVVTARHGAPLAQRLQAADETPTAHLLRFLAQGKTVRDAASDAETLRLIEQADIVICDRDGQLPPLLRRQTADEFTALVPTLNRRAWVTIAAFGLSGPYRDYRGGELVYLAAGGHLAYTRSPEDGSPLKWGGFQGSIVTGEVAGLAALHAYDLAQDGTPVHFEVSAQEAMLATGLRLHHGEVFFGTPRNLTEGAGSAGGRRDGRVSMALQECRDGYVHISAVEARTWANLVTAIGRPEWVDEIVKAGLWAERAADIRDQLRRWAQALTKEEAASHLQAHGVPATPLNGPADLLRSPQFAERGFFQADAAQGTVIAGPALVSDLGRPGARDGARRSVSSLRVIDLSQVLGPPLAAAWIGALGAEVIKIEDPQREDLQRRIGPFVDGEPGPERGGWFAETNFSKKSVLIETETDAGRAALAGLMATADVVIENMTATRARRIGAEPASFLASGPGRLFLSSTGFGRRGPLADYRTFGVQLEAYGGLMDATRDRSGAVARYNISWADMVTGVYLTGLMAAFALSDRSRRLSVDVSMAEVVARHLAGHLLAAAAGADAREEPNRIHPFAPGGVYRCGGGDDWLALAVGTQDEWQALKAALGSPQALEDASLVTPEGRWQHRDELDALLEDLLRGQDATRLFHALQRRGVPASPAWGAPALALDPHLAERRYYAELTHPVWGTRRIDGLPWRPAGGGPLPITPAPTIGQHNAELLPALPAIAGGADA